MDNVSNAVYRWGGYYEFVDGAIVGDTDKALHDLDGNGYVWISPAPAVIQFGNNAASYELWYKRGNTGFDYLFVTHSSDGAKPSMGTQPDGTVWFGAWNTGEGTLGAQIVDDNWHHIVGVKDEGTTFCRIYVDGISSVGKALTIPWVNADIYQISGGTGGPRFIDDVAIYNYALTPEQVKAHYIAGTWGSTFAQAQTRVKQVYTNHAQALATIETTYSVYAQANVYVKLSGNNAYAQAQAHIEQTYAAYAQAQAYIKGIVKAYAQAQGAIKSTTYVVGQAEAWIAGQQIKVAQAQVKIRATSGQYGQAIVYIYSPQIARPIADISNDGWVRTIIN
jgi:hypothetical protein